MAVSALWSARDTGFHDLRHYYASLLIRHGESVKTVQRPLEHATAAETLVTYAHLWPDSVLRPPPTPRSPATPPTIGRPHRSHVGPTLG